MRICHVCGCGMATWEFGRRCQSCKDSEEERARICEDRAPGGHDTVSRMKLLENGDPVFLADELARMGIGLDGDEPMEDA